MVRLIDIARQAGVSVMTVSRVLRDAPDISAATKIRVRAIAQQLGYVPDAMARSLRTRATRLLGAVVHTLADPVQSRMVQAIEERSHEMGLDLLVAQSLNQVDREDTCLRRFLARRVEGILIAPAFRLVPAAPTYAELIRRKVRVVILGPRPAFAAHFINVESDDAAASSRATQHLLGLGHRRIAYFAGPTSSPAAQARFEGYRRALREAGMEVDDALVFNAGTTIEDGDRATGQMLAESAQATAIQAVSDLVAVGTLQHLVRQGFRIPQDISVVGFGNLPVGEYGLVPLTTVRQPKYSLGSAAVQLLAQLVRDEPAESRRLPAELIVRASTGRPDFQTRFWPPSIVHREEPGV